MRFERIIRFLISKLISLVIRVIMLLPERSYKSGMITKLKFWRNRINPDIFDDIAFLSYVKKKKTALEKHVATIETLVIRGSNADYGFYSPIWENSFNLGLTSTDLYSNYHLYKNYRTSFKKLKNVLYFITVSSPGYSLIHTVERNRAIAYKFFFSIPYSNLNLINHKYEKWIYKKCEKVRLMEVEENYRGYDKKFLYGVHFNVEDRVRTHLRENNREPDQLGWLNALIDLIKEDGLKLFIIIPPFRSDYKVLLPDSSVLFRKFFSLKDIHILNYYDSDLFTDDDLGDTDHLNEQGAIKLTKEIHKYFEANNLL